MKNTFFLLITPLFLILLGFSNLYAQEPKTLRVLTYNVLADRENANTRTKALSKILEHSDADIISLQEVTPWMVTELMKQQWSTKYHTLVENGKWSPVRGLLILSKSPILKHEAGLLKSQQNRAYLIVKTTLNGNPVAIANCHLDSPLKSGKVRSNQLQFYFNTLKKYENAIFLGDFNFGDNEQPETDTIPKSYIDSWLITNKGQKGYTWNIEKSLMAKNGSFTNEKSRRIDRILIRSDKFSPIKTEILGNTPLIENKDLFPSDHFGVLSTLTSK